MVSDYCKDDFGNDCIKGLVEDLLDIESKCNIILSKPTEDDLYYNANNICHICDKQCLNKVGDQCHKTGKYRSPACKICILSYKDQIFIPVLFHNGKGYDFNLLFDEIFNQNNNQRKTKALPCGNGKTRNFRVGILKFMDSYNFKGTSICKIAEIYSLTKELLYSYEQYPYKYFKDEQSYYNILGILT